MENTDQQQSYQQDFSPEQKKSTPVTPIHTIPEKYYLGKKPDKGSKGLVIALVVLVVAALGLGAAYVFTQVINDNAANQVSNSVDSNSVSNSLLNINSNSNENINGNENANGNVNGNGNLNSAANNNANVNENTNTNSTGNFNFNVNGATNSIFNTNQSSNTNIVVIRIPDSSDLDNDGLTDVEESLYGTGVNTDDSDNDGFSDGRELVSGYSPRGTDKLIDTNLVKEYAHPSFGYRILFPSTWIRNPDPQNDSGMIFSTTTGEFISISVENNPARFAAKDWYLAASPGIDSRKIQSISNNAKTLQGVISLDEQTVYYTSGERAYVLSYNTNLLSAANFRTTFEMIYSSFELSSILLNTNSNTNLNTNTLVNNSNTNSININNTNAPSANSNTANVNANE